MPPPQISVIPRSFHAVTIACLVFLVAPILVVPLVSFTDERFLSLPRESLSLQHWMGVIGDRRWIDALVTSALSSVVAAAIAVVAGASYAIGITFLPPALREFGRATAMLPLIVPGIVNAIVVYRALARLELIDTFAAIVIAQLIVALPYAIIVLSVTLARFDQRLIFAAMTLGSSLAGAMWKVVLPNLRIPLLSAFAIALVTAWDETVIVLFVSGLRTYPLPRALWDGVRENVDPKVAVVATLLIVLTVAGVFISLWLSRKAKS